MSVAAVFYLAMPEVLIGLFLDLSDPGSAEVLAIGVAFLTIAAFFQIADGSQVIGSSILRGLSDTRIPMFYSAFGYWAIGCFSAYMLAFPLGLGGKDLDRWALGLTATAILLVRRFSLRDRLGLVERVYAAR